MPDSEPDPWSVACLMPVLTSRWQPSCVSNRQHHWCTSISVTNARHRQHQSPATMPASDAAAATQLNVPQNVMVCATTCHAQRAENRKQGTPSPELPSHSPWTDSKACLHHLPAHNPHPSMPPPPTLSPHPSAAPQTKPYDVSMCFLRPLSLSTHPHGPELTTNSAASSPSSPSLCSCNRTAPGRGRPAGLHEPTHHSQIACSGSPTACWGPRPSRLRQARAWCCHVRQPWRLLSLPAQAPPATQPASHLHAPLALHPPNPLMLVHAPSATLKQISSHRRQTRPHPAASVSQPRPLQATHSDTCCMARLRRPPDQATRPDQLPAQAAISDMLPNQATPPLGHGQLPVQASGSSASQPALVPASTRREKAGRAAGP